MQKSFVAAIGAALASATFAVHSQTLDFDGVCAAPPCAAGSLYAAAGATIAPASFEVVAAGTDGLTGTNGGSYLSIDVFPYQATITLSRTATFVTLDVARSNLTLAGQTFTLQALNSGVPVGAPQTVTLGAVNAWSNVAVSVPAGFNGIFLDAAAGGTNKTFGVDNIRIGGNCSGFSDVVPANSFCNPVEWLYNRGVTLGCVLGQYCPFDLVTRAQMALFMQRLGTALTPTVLHAFNTVTLDPSSPGATICSVSHTPTRPSAASAVGTLVASSPPGPAGYQFFIQYSTDEGATWSTFPGGNNTFATVTTGQAAAQTLVTPSLNLQVGRPYLIAGRAQRYTGTAGAVALYCYLQVTIDNANPAAALYDVRSNVRAPSPLP